MNKKYEHTRHKPPCRGYGRGAYSTEDFALTKMLRLDHQGFAVRDIAKKNMTVVLHVTPGCQDCAHWLRLEMRL
jgi:hypothetical protein